MDHFRFDLQIVLILNSQISDNQCSSLDKTYSTFTSYNCKKFYQIYPRSALPYDDESDEGYEVDKHKRHTLFAGTSVIQTRCYGRLTCLFVKGFTWRSLCRNFYHFKQGAMVGKLTYLSRDLLKDLFAGTSVIQTRCYGRLTYLFVKGFAWRSLLIWKEVLV